MAIVRTDDQSYLLVVQYPSGKTFLALWLSSLSGSGPILAERDLHG